MLRASIHGFLSAIKPMKPDIVNGIKPPSVDIDWMRRALVQAERAAELGEVPVGAVLVDATGKCLAEGHNQPIRSHDPTAHAEIRVLRQAAERLQNYRLVGSTLYVTLEPCAMCVGALVHARVKRVVYGAREYKTGAIESAGQLFEHMCFNHRVEIEGGLLEDEAARLLGDFFAQRRKQKRSLRAQTGESES